MLTLARDNLEELTGRSQPAAQIRWLNERRWVYDVGLDGQPKVALAYFERRMVRGEDSPPNICKHREIPCWDVNVEALRTV